MRHICIETGSANELQIVSQQYLETKDNAGKFVFYLRVILFYEKQEKYQRFPAKISIKFQKHFEARGMVKGNLFESIVLQKSFQF